MEEIQEINDVCKEVLTILGYFNNDIMEKIPSRILVKLNELAADSKLDYYIDKEKKLIEQDISEKSKDLIALLYYSYIANENEKYELSKIWNENEEKYQKELNEKYNSNNIFKNVNKQDSANKEELETNSNMALIEYKEPFYTKFKNFIFKILHINK